MAPMVWPGHRRSHKRKRKLNAGGPGSHKSLPAFDLTARQAGFIVLAAASGRGAGWAWACLAGQRHWESEPPEPDLVPVQSLRACPVQDCCPADWAVRG